LGEQGRQHAIRLPGQSEKGVRVWERCRRPENSEGKAREQQARGSDSTDNGRRHFDANSLEHFSFFANAAWTKTSADQAHAFSGRKLIF